MSHSLPNCNANISDGRGRKVDLLNPLAADINVDAMLHSMDNVNRYGGRGTAGRVVPTLRHSLSMALMAPTDRLKKLCVLHDASDVFCGEITRPMKVAIGYAAVKLVEDKVSAAIFQACDFVPTPEEVAACKQLDIVDLMVGKYYLGIDPGDDWGTGITEYDCKHRQHAFEAVLDMPHKDAVAMAWGILLEEC